jgi:hypothetical protein
MRNQTRKHYDADSFRTNIRVNKLAPKLSPSISLQVTTRSKQLNFLAHTLPKTPRKTTKTIEDKRSEQCNEERSKTRGNFEVSNWQKAGLVALAKKVRIIKQRIIVYAAVFDLPTGKHRHLWKGTFLNSLKAKTARSRRRNQIIEHVLGPNSLKRQTG